eukprot:tig00020592_g11630.t1
MDADQGSSPEYVVEYAGSVQGPLRHEHFQQAVLMQAFHASNPNGVLEKAPNYDEWAKETAPVANPAQANRTFAGAAKIRIGDDPPRGRYVFDVFNGAYDFSQRSPKEIDPDEIPDDVRRGHADKGLPSIAGLKIYGVSIGSFHSRSAYPLRIALRASSEIFAIDFASFCPKIDLEKEEHIQMTHIAGGGDETGAFAFPDYRARVSVYI